MSNRLQKLLFNLSTVAPLGFILVLVYWTQQNVPPIIDSDVGKIVVLRQHTFLIILAFACLYWSFYGTFFIRECKKKLERVHIAVDSISNCDGWAISIFVTYVLPLASFVFDDYNQLISVGVLLLLVIIAALSNAVLPSPLLIIKGYHFYSVTNVDGGGEFFLISKRRRINNRKTVKKVVCAFDYLMIEMR